VSERKFEWHSGKAAINIVRHDVTFEEAATVFDDPRRLQTQEGIRYFAES